MTTIEDLVEQQGPMPLSRSPFNKGGGKPFLQDRLRDHPSVNLFWPQSEQHTSDFKPGVDHEPVLYHDSHSKHEVVEVYLDNNSILLERSPWKSIHWVICGNYPEFKEASRDVVKKKKEL